ncbi:MAG TPA: extracellular solute-binding protein [Candidatus Paceibacterota bacterium]|nr:extracellular solute-binding protein [Candidatus Paceibacterota bacterium]
MPTKLTQKQVIIIGFAFFVVLLVGVVVYFNLRPSSKTVTAKLVVWGTDDPQAMKDMFDAYKSANHGAEITYRQIDASTYQTTLLAALAAGTGPDVFEINDHDLPLWENVVAPMPATNIEQFSLVTLQNDFPTVVSQDFVDGGNVYALPLSLDTLAMYYNKDLVDSAGIAEMPKTWDEFDTDVTRLRETNAQGQITQAGAAIGGSAASIPNAVDILYLLMLQNGTQMTTPTFSGASFAGTSGGASPGLSAFNFYLQFANPGSPYYTWTDELGDAESNFIQGKAAILFDYAAAATDIKQKAPFLHYAVAAVPQPSGATISVSYPSYQGLAVARFGQVAAAWNFVIGLTTDNSLVGLYNKETGTPSALRSVIQANANDPTLSIFGTQALTARSWHEADSGKIADVMNAAIVSVLNGSAESTKALQTAQAGVNAIIQSK